MLPIRNTSRLILLDQLNRIFLICYEASRDVDQLRPGLRTKSDWVDTSNLQATENDPVIATKWWTINEIAKTTDIIIPNDLIRLIKLAL